MYVVCTANLEICSEWEFLGAAKDHAKHLAKDGSTYFVCGSNGMIIAGY